jgi:hypothetical protein
MSAPVQSTPNQAAPSALEPFPCTEALQMATKLAIKHGMPIHLDYYVDTATGKAFIGEDNTNPNERVLLKSAEEFTSLIDKLGKAGNDLIIMTENSIYIISSKTMKKKVSMDKLHGASDDSE